jgi:hypothetical protein
MANEKEQQMAQNLSFNNPYDKAQGLQPQPTPAEQLAALAQAPSAPMTPASPEAAVEQHLMSQMSQEQQNQPIPTARHLSAVGKAAEEAMPEKDRPYMQQFRGASSGLSPKARAMRDKQTKSIEDYFNVQKSEIHNIDADLTNMRKEAAAGGFDKLDLSPLLAYVDSIVPGSNLMKGYKPPKNREERQVMVKAMEDKLMKRRAELSKQQINYLNAMQSDSMFGGLSGKDKRFQQRMSAYMQKDIKKDLDKMSDDLNGTLRDLSNLSDNLSPSEPNGGVSRQKLMSIAGVFARKISGEKGVLTDRDITRIMPATWEGSWADFVNYIGENGPKGTVNPEWTGNMLDMIQTSRRNFKNYIDNRLEDVHGMYYDMDYAPGVMDPGGPGDRMFRRYGDTLNKRWGNLKKKYDRGDEGTAEPKGKKETTKKPPLPDDDIFARD